LNFRPERGDDFGKKENWSGARIVHGSLIESARQPRNEIVAIPPMTRQARNNWTTSRWSMSAGSPALKLGQASPAGRTSLSSFRISRRPICGTRTEVFSLLHGHALEVGENRAKSEPLGRLIWGGTRQEFADQPQPRANGTTRRKNAAASLTNSRRGIILRL
jgi:hypothetical protein